MTSAELAELTRLRRRVTDLEAELAEWRAADGAERARLTRDRRLLAVRRRLKLRPGAVAGLLHMLDHSGQAFSMDQLARVVSPHPDDVDARLNVRSSVCHIHAALRRAQIAARITNHFGFGYAIDPADAAVIRAALGLDA